MAMVSKVSSGAARVSPSLAPASSRGVVSTYAVAIIQAPPRVGVKSAFQPQITIVKSTAEAVKMGWAIYDAATAKNTNLLLSLLSSKELAGVLLRTTNHEFWNIIGMTFERVAKEGDSETFEMLIRCCLAQQGRKNNTGAMDYFVPPSYLADILLSSAQGETEIFLSLLSSPLANNISKSAFVDAIEIARKNGLGANEFYSELKRRNLLNKVPVAFLEILQQRRAVRAETGSTAQRTSAAPVVHIGSHTGPLTAAAASAYHFVPVANAGAQSAASAATSTQQASPEEFCEKLFLTGLHWNRNTFRAYLEEIQKANVPIEHKFWNLLGLKLVQFAEANCKSPIYELLQSDLLTRIPEEHFMNMVTAAAKGRCNDLLEGIRKILSPVQQTSPNPNGTAASPQTPSPNAAAVEASPTSPLEEVD